MRLNLPRASRSGDLVAEAAGVAKRYGDRTLFEGLDLTIKRGERIGIIGPNGVGKTTLVRILLGEIEPDEGTVRLGSRVSVGYYRQSQEKLDLSLEVYRYLQSVIVSLDGQAKASEQQARDLAGAFLFSGPKQDKVLADMSGGERSRAVLAGLVAGAHNLLVLDEPTNHLDIPAMERVEQALSREGGFEGTILLISHDRALLDAVCDRLIVFDGRGGVTQFQGTLVEWLRREQARQAKVAGRRRPAAPGAPGAPKPPKKPAAASDGVQRQRSALARMSLGKLETEIETIETRIREIDRMMVDPNVYTDGKRVKALQFERATLHKKLEPLEFEWAARADDE